MPNNWNAVFQAVQAQGKSPPSRDPKSPSDVYFADLDKAEWDESDNAWYLMFDMIPAEAALLGLAGSTGDGMPPSLPTIIFHATKSLPGSGLHCAPARGERRAGRRLLVRALPGKGRRLRHPGGGDLYHHDTDFLGKNVPSYGAWHISSADLIALPGSPKAGMMFSLPRPQLGARPQAKFLPRTYCQVRKLGMQLARFLIAR